MAGQIYIGELEGRVRRLFDEELKMLACPAFIVQSDEAAREAWGTNPLDPSIRVPALEAGLRQGRALARDLAAYWRA